jgi:hypothetical protein
VSDLITPELLERELDEPVLMMPGPVPVRASDVTIQSIIDEARAAEVAIAQSRNHVVLTARDRREARPERPARLACDQGVAA